MIHLLARCGIGDVISHLTRIEDIKLSHNDDNVKFWLGGYENVPNLCKNILDIHNIESEIIKGWKNIDQNNMILNHIKNKVDKNDIIIDLNFEVDIFNNKIPAFYSYKMQFPFEYKSDNINDEFLKSNNVVGLQIKTTSGAPDFDHAGKRFWDINKWKQLIELLVNSGHKVAIFGTEKDNIDIQENGFIKSYCGKLTINQTIDAIKKCSSFIGTNSWMWEVAAFSGIRTVCLYFTNTFFSSLHIPFHYSDIHRNLFIETNPSVDAQHVYDALTIKENNIKISACIITQNEANLLDKCLSNLNGYIDEIIVVDGGSNDNSVEIAKKYTDKIFFRIFDNHMNQKNFAVEQASSEWVLIQDTDEFYEYGFLNNMKKYIELNKSVDMFLVPRINVIEDLNEEIVKKYNFNVHPFFKWINYPDPQERLFKTSLRHNIHPVHHHVVGYKKHMFIQGLHSIHIKNSEKQIYQNERYKEIEKEWKKI